MELCFNMKLFVAFVFLGFGSACHWSYEEIHGPDFWSACFPTCDGSSQSPIDITYEELDVSLNSLEFINYGTSFTGLMKNNGHTIEIDIPEGVDLTLAHGGLSSEYIAEQFHFHWGEDDNEGSEHNVYGDAYPMEMHVVHYKEEYGSVANALDKSDGLAVVSFLFEIDDDDNDNYSDLVNALQNVIYKGTHTVLYGVNLLDLTLGNLPDGTGSDDLPAFYRYQGSLTTPACSEIVTWTVMRDFVPISSEQVAAFRQVAEKSSGAISATDKITHNFRPVQPLNGRKIFSSV